MVSVDAIPWEAAVRGGLPSAVALHLLRLCAAGESCAAERAKLAGVCLVPKGDLGVGVGGRGKAAGAQLCLPFVRGDWHSVGWLWPRYKSDNAD